MRTSRRVVLVPVLAAVLVLAIVAIIAVPAGAAKKAPKLQLTSPAFTNGGEIPIGFTCDGASASPPLVWKHVPKKTVQLALIVDDPDAPGGTFVHWVAWNVDPKAGELPEQNPPATIVQGANAPDPRSTSGRARRTATRPTTTASHCTRCRSHRARRPARRPTSCGPRSGTRRWPAPGSSAPTSGPATRAERLFSERVSG